MKKWEQFQEEAAKRDHRKIGKVGKILKKVTHFFELLRCPSFHVTGTAIVLLQRIKPRFLFLPT